METEKRDISGGPMSRGNFLQYGVLLGIVSKAIDFYFDNLWASMNVLTVALIFSFTKLGKS